MTQPALQFDTSQKIGRVTSVDTSRVFINVDNHDLLTRISVGQIIAINGYTPNDYLIALVERVTRQIKEDIFLEDEDVRSDITSENREDTLRAVLIGTFKSKYGTSYNTFKRGADTFPQIDRDSYIIESSNLQNFMNLLAKDLDSDKMLQLGHFVIDKSAVAIADGDKFFQRHASILGSTGSGKSWTVSLIIEKAHALAYPNIIVFDMHGEYTPLASSDSAIASRYKIAGPGDIDIPEDKTLFLPYWLLNREEMLAMILDRTDQNAPNQASRFTTHVRCLKEEYLKNQKKDTTAQTFTVDSPIPYSINDLITKLDSDNTATRKSSDGKREIKGEWADKLTRFISRLESKIEDRRYGFMFRPPNDSTAYSWLEDQLISLLYSDNKNKGIKIIDFSEVPSDILPIITGVLARLIFDIQFWISTEHRTPITIICDEAHLYLPIKDESDAIEKRSLESFERIAKEGRKYGISLLIVSQRPSDVSRTILSQCNNFIVLRLTNDRDQSVIKRLMPDSMAGLIDSLPLLDVGEALILGDSILLPTRIILDSPKIKPNSATRNFWTEWNQNPPSKEAIVTAVETLRRQTRVDLMIPKDCDCK